MTARDQADERDQTARGIARTAKCHPPYFTDSLYKNHAEAPNLDAPATGETRRHVLEHHVERKLHVAHRQQGPPVRNVLE